ncbi:AAA family ATPase [Oricola thermophila]|uniref:Response regulator receiver protein n=1 Tax=Oricola thermophila TaxID=2742145 RepID=A0A6N1VA20_9HYPH|nr:response regulator receiver protein [Oricola thermophila]QKV17786.1 response regulator receiver protein [Oricola thermophila]
MTDAKPRNNTVVLVSTDRQFTATTQTAFSVSDAITLVTIDKDVTELQGEISDTEAGTIIIDIDEANLERLEALQRVTRRLTDRVPVIVVASSCEPAMVRIVVQLHVADFLVKPVSTTDLVRSCIRALKGMDKNEAGEADISAFMPVAGGVGNTTIALQTAFLLHRSATRAASTCVVDLNFQNGSCAEYLDLEPRFDITEIENQVERLDRQLLDAMLSKHSSGLAVLAAPNMPMEMRSFDVDVVIRVLDLVSAYFDNVIIDVPRTWFPWTETVLRGSNHVYLTAEMTVPCLRHTQRLLHAIETEIGKEVKPRVIVNRFAQKGLEGGGVRAEDVEEVLGERFAGGISNNYRLVREAVDRGVPLHEIDAHANVVLDLKRIILPDEMQLESSRKRGLLGLGRELLKKAS